MKTHHSSSVQNLPSHMHCLGSRFAANQTGGKSLNDVNTFTQKPLEPESTLKKYSNSQLSMIHTVLKNNINNSEKKLSQKFDYSQAVQALDYKLKVKQPKTFMDMLFKSGFVEQFNKKREVQPWVYKSVRQRQAELDAIESEESL